MGRGVEAIRTGRGSWLQVVRRRRIVQPLVGLAGCLVALAAAPGALAAGTVSISMVSGAPVFQAGAGDVNDVTATADEDSGSVTIADASNPVSEAEADCVSNSPNEVVCTNPGYTFFELLLGDQDDTTVANGSLGGRLDGEAGDDTLTGSDVNTDIELLVGGLGNDVLDTRNVAHLFPGTAPLSSDGFPTTLTVQDRARGDEGNDRITTGDGDDDAAGGDGTDIVSTGAGDDEGVDTGGDGDSYDLGPGDDTMQLSEEGNGNSYVGGPGADLLEYAPTGPPSGSFAVDLNAGTASQTAPLLSSSTATGFEDARTSAGDDSVVGTAGANGIFTGSGSDSVDPLAGADQLDLLDGDDAALVRDGFFDRVLCGAGSDSVQADQLDELVDCEIVEIAPVRPAGADLDAPDCHLQRVRRSYRRSALLRGIVARARCDEPTLLQLQLIARVKPARRGRLITARAGDLVLAERNLALGEGLRRARLRPPRRLRRALRRARRARVVLTAHDQFGNRDTATRNLRIRPNKRQGRR